jgi:hypothetical protein
MDAIGDALLAAMAAGRAGEPLEERELLELEMHPPLGTPEAYEASGVCHAEGASYWAFSGTSTLVPAVGIYLLGFLDEDADGEGRERPYGRLVRL